MAQMACDRVQVSRFTGRKVGERVLSEATGIDPVRSSVARSGPEHSQLEQSQQEHVEPACSQAGHDSSERG